jgi:hypothetical protein
MATEQIETDDAQDEASRRMPSDLKTIGAIIRLLDKHEPAEAADIMDYVGRRAKRLAMIQEVDLRR